MSDVARVHGAVCDRRTKIMLDSGSTNSILSLRFARELGLKLSFDDQMQVKGFGGSSTAITAQATVKITLGINVVYYMEIWVGEIGGDVDCLLGMDFMTAAGVRICAHEGTVQLPDEERIPLAASGPRPRLPARFSVWNDDTIYLGPGASTGVNVPWAQARRSCGNASLVTWMFRGKGWVTSLQEGANGQP